MSHHRHDGASSSNHALLLFDIDDELDGWADQKYQHTGENVSEDASPPALPDVQHDPAPPSTAEDRMEDPEADTSRHEENTGDDDEVLFISLTSSSVDGRAEAAENQQAPEPPLPNWNWGELDEFDSEDDEEVDVCPAHAATKPAHERIALHDKSQRAAAKIIKDADWERDVGLPVLTEILIYHHCHSKTIGALRELTIGHRVEPQMLRTLHEIRAAWRSHGYNRVYSAFGACDGWTNLPWGMALQIIKVLGVQSGNEVMEFCSVCFDDWCEVGVTEFPIFAYYLNFVVSTIDSPLADTALSAARTARAMLTDRGEQYDLPGNPVDQALKYYGIT